MRHRLVLAASALVAGACLLGGADEAQASSHREAPFVTKNPKVDSTDFYMFRSYETGRDGFTTILVNYQPFEDPFAGPNYYSMDPEALYEIHIDNNGDGAEDITFQFRFQQALANGGTGVALPITLGGETKTNAIPLLIGGTIDSSETNRNFLETYTVNVVRGDRRTGQSSPITKAGDAATTTFKKPLDNIGHSTFGTGNAYQTYASGFVNSVDIPGCSTAGSKIWVGQRKESFAVNVGLVFDLVGVGGGATVAGILTQAANGGNDSDATRGKNAGDPGDIGVLNHKSVTTLAIEVPTACLTKSADAADAIIGGWTTASMRQARVLNPGATFTTPSKEGGAWTQVSRLGMPLVNEVVIGLKDKDHFSASAPKDDKQFADYVTHPTLPALLEVLYGNQGVQAPKAKRADLVAAFAQGVTVTAVDDTKIKLTQNTDTGIFEYTRLNTALPPTTKANQKSLGALGCFIAAGDAGGIRKVDTGLASCDVAGFPNGRRPGDDVTDIELRVAMGALFADAAVAPNHFVNFTDANYNGPEQFGDTFPYLNTPDPGSAVP